MELLKKIFLKMPGYFFRQRVLMLLNVGRYDDPAGGFALHYSARSL